MIQKFPSDGVKRLLFGAWMLATAVCAIAADVVKVGGSGTLLGAMHVLAEAYKRDDPRTEIAFVANLGSSGGVRALLGGAIDIALNARPLKPAESQGGATAQVLGRTPFVFAVASRRPETALTETRLVEIFTGKRTRWDDGVPIRLALRPADDSDNDAIDALSPAMSEARRAAHARPGMFFAASDQENADHIERIPGGFGGVALAVILSEKRELRPLKLDGVEPTAQALAQGTYRLHKPLYVVTRNDPSPAARRFLDFLASPRGKALMRSVGVVPAGD